MMVRKDIKAFLQQLPKDITLVAATKYVDIDDMIVLFQNDIKNFGENRVDSFLRKYDSLSSLHPTWHFIGHLQRNKALKIIDKIDYLHSLDSLELAKIIDLNRTTPLKCFIEVSINSEKEKNGVPLSLLHSFFKEIICFHNIEIVGLMMMAIKNDDDKSLQKQFASLRLLKEQLEKDFNIKIPYLSMGMSDDYELALKEGATHIRLGRILFDK